MQRELTSICEIRSGAGPARGTPGHIGATAILLLLACVHAQGATSPTAPNTAFARDDPYAHPQRRVDIGHGRRMNLYCIGSGTPTVLFDSGLSDWGYTWALVQPAIAQRHRACVYDRAGLGYSDASGRASRSDHIVDDLHALLAAARIAPPYLLVGHSFGGLNMRLFADRYLDDVSGMVLVDPSHEDGIARIDADRNGQETRRFTADIARLQQCQRESVSQRPRTPGYRQRCLEPDDPRYSATLNRARARIARQPAYQAAQLSEFQNYLDGNSFRDVRNARRSYGMLPLIVLTSPQTMSAAGPQWRLLHQELAALSGAGEQRIVAGAGHYVQLDRPEAVIAAIEDVAAKSGKASPD